MTGMKSHTWLVVGLMDLFTLRMIRKPIRKLLSKRSRWPLMVLLMQRESLERSKSSVSSSFKIQINLLFRILRPRKYCEARRHLKTRSPNWLHWSVHNHWENGGRSKQINLIKVGSIKSALLLPHVLALTWCLFPPHISHNASRYQTKQFACER